MRKEYTVMHPELPNGIGFKFVVEEFEEDSIVRLEDGTEYIVRGDTFEYYTTKPYEEGN